MRYRKNPFKTPEHYFTGLEQKIQRKISTAEPNAPYPIKWAYALAPLLIIALIAGYFMTDYSVKPQKDEAYSMVEPDDIYAWFYFNETEIPEAFLAETVEENMADVAQELDFYFLEDLDTEDLEYVFTNP
ncbi:MAG: hypothetical protein ACXITV_04715 [Luteibaculaceae bacterium]